jgi:large subunit ribosomal protein L17
MSASLILHKRINTTVAKAKALRTYVEPVITKSKEDTTSNRRLAFSYLGDKDAVKELFRVVSPKVVSRPGGYTRILKTGARPGDNSQMCFIELVDFNDAMLGTKKAEESAAKKGTRRGRGGKKAAAAGAATEKADKTAEASA